MQVIFEDEDKRSRSERTNPVGIIVCTVWVSRCMEKNLLEDLKLRKVEFKSTREFLLEIKKKFREGYKKLVKLA